MLKNYFKIAFRSLLKRKAFSAINVFGLSVGMSVSMLIIMIIADQTSYDQEHPDAERIYRVVSKQRISNGVSHNHPFVPAPAPLANKLAEEAPSVETVVRIKSALGGDGKANERLLPVSGYFVEPEFFDLFAFELEEGDAAQALEKPYSIVLTQETARKFFGEEDPVGQTFDYQPGWKPLGSPEDATTSFTVTGVLRPLVKTHFDFEALASYASVPLMEERKVLYKTSNDWETYWWDYVYLKLEEGSTPADQEGFLAETSQTQYADPTETGSSSASSP